MPIAERIRENAERRRQREIFLQRMEPATRPHIPPPFTIAVERTKSTPRSGRRRKQWTFHFTITLSLPVFSLARPQKQSETNEVRHQRSQRYSTFVRRSRRRYGQFKESLPSPKRTIETYRRASSQKREEQAMKREAMAREARARETAKARAANAQSPKTQAAKAQWQASHQNAPAPARSSAQQHSRGGAICPLCRTETVVSRTQGREDWLRYVGVSVRRCPRCLHRFYYEPLVLRPVGKLVRGRPSTKHMPLKKMSKHKK